MELGGSQGEMNLALYFDGLCEPMNPRGVATYGIVIYKDGKTLMEDCGLACKPWSDEASNNVAEYTALIKGLEWLLKKGLTHRIVARGDSKLVVSQMKGEWKVKATRVKPLYKRAKELSSKFTETRFELVPRERNKETDALSRRAYKEQIEKEKAGGA